MPDTIDTTAGSDFDHRTAPLRPRLLLYAAGAWVGMVGLAILNATARELFVTPTVGDYAAHVISTATLLVLLAGYVTVYLRRMPGHTRRERVVVGVLWAGLTVAFEVGFGLFVAGATPADLLQQYDVTQGYVWILVPLFLLVAPTLAGRSRAQ